jgi:nucleolar protein 6
MVASQTRRTLKVATPQGMDSVRQETLQPQRFSTTSGEGEVPHTKRTWTVGDGDQGDVRRGGKKAGKKRGTRTKNFGTGVNALPIG